MSEGDARRGEVLEGKYLLSEQLGRGGMGAVHRAERLELGGEVAVKFLHPMFGREPDLRERFRREAMALSRLRHPGIVSLLDYGERDGELYIVMELVVGRSLADVIADGPLSPLVAGVLFDELLDVLSVAHDAGIVHRDVKPSNVMVLAGDRIKLLDFGLVHLEGLNAAKLTATGMAQGTPEYMSPEQAQGEPTGPPTDVYAVGVMLYECLTGASPFDGRSAAELMAQHLFVDPPPMRERGAKRDVPRPLEALVRRALAKRPESRPTARALRAELSSILAGTDPASLAERAAKERLRAAGLPREERAITAQRAPAPAPPPADARVEIRTRDEARASRLRSALAVHGVDAAVASLEADVAPDTRALVFSARDGLGFVERAEEAKVPAVVVDVNGPDEARAAVRSGASDMATVDDTDAEAAARVVKLLRRTR